MYSPQYNIVEDYNHYLQNKAYFYSKYPEKYIIIRHKKVEGVFDNYTEAHTYGVMHFRIFDYYIQYCFLPKSNGSGTAPSSENYNLPDSLNT